MNRPRAWKPSLIWHAKFFGAVLAVCTAAYFVLACITDELPAPYQKRRPAPETTPWLNSER